MSTGICGSRLSTCSMRPRQALNMMPSFSAKARIAAHISPLMLFKVVSMSVRKVDSYRSYWSWWLYITLCISFHTASASEWRRRAIASCSASETLSHKIAKYAASWPECPSVSVSCAISWIELWCMASSPDSTSNSLASLMPSA